MDEILNFLTLNAQEVPQNIINDFNEYKKLIDKIKIKKVMILEYPKELEKAIEENKKISKLFIEDNKKHKIINSKKVRETKTTLENNNLFCVIDEK